MKKNLKQIGMLLLGTALLSSCGNPKYKNARIKQVNGVGEKYIYDYNHTWEKLPFNVGDTISDRILPDTDRSYRLIDILFEESKWVVLEVND